MFFERFPGGQRRPLTVVARNDGRSRFADRRGVLQPFADDRQQPVELRLGGAYDFLLEAVVEVAVGDDMVKSQYALLVPVEAIEQGDYARIVRQRIKQPQQDFPEFIGHC